MCAMCICLHFSHILLLPEGDRDTEHEALRDHVLGLCGQRGAVAGENLHFTVGEPGLGTGNVVDAVAVTAPRWDLRPHGEQGEGKMGPSSAVCRAVSYLGSHFTAQQFDQGRVIANCISYSFLFTEEETKGQRRWGLCS